MKSGTKFLFAGLFGGAMGFVLAMFGIYWYTWQFWVIDIPVLIAFNLFMDLIEEKRRVKKEENETAE